MKRQIFFFHMATLIVALLTLLAVSGGVLHLVFRAYQDQAVPAADSRSDQVQSTLANWPEEARDWWELDQSFGQAGLPPWRWKRTTGWSTPLSPTSRRISTTTLADASWPELGTLALQDQGVLMGPPVRKRGPGGHDGGDPRTRPQRPQNEAALISFSVSGLAAIAIIGVLSFLFTQYQVRRILKPVNAIIQAAGRVERGDLSTPRTARGRTNSPRYTPPLSMSTSGAETNRRRLPSALLPRDSRGQQL